MPVVKDPDGTQWRVRRRWWPYSDTLDALDFALMDWLAVALALPFLLVWPFWLLAKLFGARWSIIVEREGVQAHRELVRWWGASEARIAELAQEIQQGSRSGYFQI
ncbi:hypothetical protein ACNO8X_18195 [Mycobacterium sp. PDNC021]|uniref:hypothetical protein n=1 Tax=Mycobacterium sp. PDNC021 TaxID=3391399 RepID=UPI003AAC9E0B